MEATGVARVPLYVVKPFRRFWVPRPQLGVGVSSNVKRIRTPTQSRGRRDAKTLADPPEEEQCPPESNSRVNRHRGRAALGEPSPIRE
jgi:hypothetical protein